MRRYLILFPAILIYSLMPGVLRAADSSQTALNARAADAYRKLPLAFIENKGQLNKQVRYVIYGPGSSAFFGDDGVTLDLRDAFTDPANVQSGKNHIPGRSNNGNSADSKIQKHIALKLTFKGADPNCRVVGIDELPGKVNFLSGQDSSKWNSDIPTFKGIVYKDVWSGVDVIYRGDRHQLKYDIQVNPGADLKKIHLNYQGAEKIWLDKAGNLHIQTAVKTFVEKIPGIYQDKDGKHIAVNGRYILLDAQTVGFRTDKYDESIPLVIDPSSDLIYSTHLGGGGLDSAYSITVDSSGCAYVTGLIESSNFPTTPGAFQTTFQGNIDAFVTKLNASGTALIYSTLLMGSDSDVAYSIAVDSLGSAYVAGYTHSSDFPTTTGAFQTTLKGDGDIFVTKLNVSGSGLNYSTFIGGDYDDESSSIKVDSSGCVYVAGYTRSSDFPTTTGAFQTTLKGEYDAFVTKLSASGSELIYSTYLGGDYTDYADSIAIDSSGSAYVAGTCSADFPTTAKAFQTTYKGYGDAFVTKLNASGTGLLYSTFLGGNDSDHSHSVTVDSLGCVYVAGEACSSDFPTTTGAFQTTLQGNVDGFVTKLNSSGSTPIFSTYLGRAYDDSVHSVTIDSSGYAYLTGATFSDDFPTTTGAFQTTVGDQFDAFVTKLNAMGSGLIYSTYLGGGDSDYPHSIALDSSGCVYVAGSTGNIGFPTTAGAFQMSSMGGYDAFVSKINMGVFVNITSPTIDPSYATTSQIVLLRGTASGNGTVTSVSWSNDRGGSGLCSGTTYWSRSIKLLPGTNVITLTATDSSGNIGNATLTVYTDITPPIVKITVPTTVSTYSTTSQIVLFRGTVVDNGTVESVSWSNDRGGSGLCSGTTYWSRSIKFLPGVNAITITATDTFGNTDAATLTVKYTDITPPTVNVTVPTTASTYATTSQIVLLRGTAADNCTVESVSWSNDRGGSGTCSGTTFWSRSIKFMPGENVITLTATDTYGNKSTSTLTVTYTDIIPPVVSITSPSSTGTYSTGSSTINVACNASDNVGTTSVTWSNDLGGSGTCTFATSWKALGIPLKFGVNTITLSAADAAGNKGSASIQIIR